MADQPETIWLAAAAAIAELDVRGHFNDGLSAEDCKRIAGQLEDARRKAGRIEIPLYTKGELS